MQSFLIKNTEVQCATWIKSFSNFLTTKHSNLKSEHKSRQRRKNVFPKIKAVISLFY